MGDQGVWLGNLGVLLESVDVRPDNYCVWLDDQGV